ncbi:hypothetical protein KCMC57_up61580 [Kitasatospora sp. CMC57]|uniref:ABM domain-containing protein n=1 Tax=Kitasatospora sp. CMC57 TaxID=3231513 RepID=A0AB33K6D3_9ACTN
MLPGITTDQYDSLNARLQQTPEIFEGCLSHACVPTDGGLEIYDIWESERHMAAFAEKMGPVAAEQGLPAQPGQTDVFPLHNHWVPGA